MNIIYGECGKHPGNNMVNCSMCAIENQTLKINIMEQKNVIDIHCGKMIYEKRKKLKYNQDELASAIGLTRTSVVNMEKGRQGMTVETLLKLCAVLQCKVTDILPAVPSVKLKPVVKVKKVIESKNMDATFKW